MVEPQMTSQTIHLLHHLYMPRIELLNIRTDIV